MALFPVIVPPVVKQTATIIFLHGLGDSGCAWAEILRDLRPKYAKLICPNAPEQPVTINGGQRLRAWFDLRPMDQPKDDEGIQASMKLIEELVKEEAATGIPTSRILVGGFSQGGALALYMGLMGTFSYPGILALSTWLPVARNIDWKKVHKPKILQCHGEMDQVVPFPHAQKTAEILRANAPRYTFKTYKSLEHTINSKEEQSDIKEFLDEMLPKIHGDSKL